MLNFIEAVVRGSGFFLLFFTFPASAFATKRAHTSSQYEVELPLLDDQRTSSPPLSISRPSQALSFQTVRLLATLLLAYQKWAFQLFGRLAFLVPLLAPSLSHLTWVQAPFLSRLRLYSILLSQIHPILTVFLHTHILTSLTLLVLILLSQMPD